MRDRKQHRSVANWVLFVCGMLFLFALRISVFGNFPDNDGAVYYNITKRE